MSSSLCRTNWRHSLCRISEWFTTRNALFYKTLNGARVGDLFMSLIHTSELNSVNPFDYLTELQRHAEALKHKPSEWMPWNYRETLARSTTPTAA
jgi:transposase